jgi:hypothetical protein
MGYQFNPHGNVTANGVLITEGLMVITNEMEAGRILVDESSGEHLCCSDNKCFPGAEHHSKGQVQLSGAWFTDHELGVNAVDGGCYCRHNHWFRVETKRGTKSFDGERVATYFQGRSAQAMWDEA